jgi:small conductance mechanosensitive channel
MDKSQQMLDTAIQFLQNQGMPFIINLFTAILIFWIGKKVVKVIVKLVKKVLEKAKMDDMLVSFVGAILNGLLMIVIAVAALDQLGVPTNSLVALIGAAGIAIGMAMKDSLNNFACGVLLIVFKPFKIGDFVEAAGVAGTIEKISIFNTIFKTGDNKQVIVANGSIYGGTITNFSAKPTRRVDMVFGIGYDADIKKAKEILMDIVVADERVLADPAPLVAVSELADSSVNFVVRPWVNSADYWNVNRDTHEKVKLAFDDAGISIPFPQMDVHLQKADNS